MDPDSSLRVSVSDGRGRPIRDGGLARWLAALSPARVRGEVAVAIVTDSHIRTLNRRYRGKDAATDVLSFPAEPGLTPDGSASRAAGNDRRAAPTHLGDIVIARGTASRQAREAGHTLDIELRVLALHGLLHLLGYDHETPSDKGRMARAEARLRRKGGLPHTLIARARRTAAMRNTRSTGKHRKTTRAPRRDGGEAAPVSARRAGVGLGSHSKRPRPARAAGGERGEAAPVSARRAGVGPRSHRK